ncbi:hypothetical protein Tco_1079331 [Tanacetum coccineum]|uniref:Uncharacterized protein n=1 Tax=Tanacetum coccineum TaxID=301880 RepID=A0ABQ5HRH6_9ASTR
MTRSSTKELFTPLDNLERVFRSKRRLFETPGLVEWNSPKFDLFSDIEERHGSEHEEANEHIEKVLEIVDLFHISNIAFPVSLTGAEVLLFYNGLDVLTKQILDSKGVAPSMTAANAKVAIQQMVKYS